MTVDPFATERKLLAVSSPCGDPMGWWLSMENLGPQLIGILVVILIAWLLGFPLYRVWFAHKKGQADLARAQNEQQIQVAQANGRLMAAEANKKAAIVEAEAVAKQIEVIGANLQKHDLYLKWQWIKMMEEREGETIYVPTETNLPILEATRLAPVTMPMKKEE